METVYFEISIMRISLADSIHEVVSVIVKTFDIKSSLPQDPISSALTIF